MSSKIDAILQSARQARNEQSLQDARRTLLEGMEAYRQTGRQAELALVLKALGQIERDMGNPRLRFPFMRRQLRFTGAMISRSPWHTRFATWLISSRI